MVDPVVKDINSLHKKRWWYLFLQVLVSFATQFTYSLAVYIGPLNETKGWSVSQILLTYTIAIWMTPIASIVGGKARDTWGNKPCIIVGGVLYGIFVAISGFSPNVTVFIIVQGAVTAFFMYAVYLAQLENVTSLFPEISGTAVGILSGGTSLFASALPVISVHLIGWTGVELSLVITGAGFSVICLVCGLLIFGAPADYQGDPRLIQKMKGEQKEEEDPSKAFNISWRYLLRQPSFYLITLYLVLFCMLGGMMQANLSLMTQQATGANEISSAWLITAGTIILGIGGIVVGFVSDKIGVYKTLALCSGIQGIIVVICFFVGVDKMAMYAFTVLVVEFLFGGIVALIPIITRTAFGSRFFGVNMGLMSFANMICSFIGPQMSVFLPIGKCFLVCGILALVGVFVMRIAESSIKKMQSDKRLIAIGNEWD